jgi:hypothetical protein
MDPVATRAHYDNTGTAVADIAAGEDQFGIWYNGSLQPDIDDVAVRRLRGSALSGDWRGIGGHYELVAALAVNTPGYSIRRPQARVASGRPLAMVAAGMVTPATIRKQATKPASTGSHRVVDDAYKNKVVRDTLRNRVHGN